MFSSLNQLDTTDDVLVAYFFQGNNLCLAAHHVVALVSALNFGCLSVQLIVIPPFGWFGFKPLSWQRPYDLVEGL